jgi:enamine deaminase RidA (YjgF/YER057c/UK114 family)
VSVWIYGIQNITIEHTPDGAVCVKRPFYTHLFHTQLQTGEGDSYEQTVSVFKRYIDSLHNFGATLGSHCIRTWLYVQNIDVQYAGMVKGRKMIFHQENLVPETHYIASTGIEGRSVQHDVSVIMDAYAIPKVRNEQISYLTGIGYLNPTDEYGVTFERGTVVCYGDRQHVFISGTASINDRGEIVHPQNIQKQTARTLENIGALLGEAGCSMSDIAYMLVYLRDIANYKQAEAFLQAKYPHIPKIIVLAPVCRPGWLIEIECMAIRAVNDDRFEQF